MQYRKRGRSRRPRSLFSLGWPIVLLMLVLWGLAMGFITEMTAAELMQQAKVAAAEYVTYYAQGSFSISYPGITKESPGYAQVGRLHVANSWIGSSGDFWFNHTIDTSFPFIEEPSSYTYRTSDLYYMEGNYAVRYRESDGDVQKSGNYLCFPYMSEERWYAEETAYEGLAYVDYSRCDIGSIYGWTDTARLTGYFEGNEFILLRLETVKGPEYQPVYMRYALEWETQFVDPPLPEKGTVVIYTSHLQQIRHDIGGAVTIDGVVYQDLMEVLSQNYVGEDNLKNTVVICDSDFVDHTGELVNVSIALKVNPLAYTLRKLTWFYLLSFLILAAAVGLYLWYVWRKLTAPLERITQAVAAGSALPEDVSTACWQEPLLLQEYYATTYRTAHENQTEIKRLQTALEYARNAEENRRRMISNITHELKTPLAVIHSYAEGLQDGIAADKQDQYLNIILEETVKMDAMVLEMLELSRLEAGKVRLASDRFVLSGLVQSVFEKLEPLAKKKDLKIRYDLLEAFEITADESRIGQVITNFVTNAIKYSPEGGEVVVNVYRHGGKHIFSVDNRCQPLTQEELDRVWDSFYRAEQSRTTKGTGLGLTIAKAIIELHGGTCAAASTSEGVQFRFTLP